MRLSIAGLIALSLIGAAACADDSPNTTRGAYDAEEVRELELRANAGDRGALRELDIFYGMEGRAADRARIHQRRLEINDREAVEEEAMKLVIAAEREIQCESKRRLLVESRTLIIDRLFSDGDARMNIDPTYQLISGKIDELSC
jgi:hypothetical protein